MTAKAERQPAKLSQTTVHTLSAGDDPVAHPSDHNLSQSGIWSAFSVWETRIKAAASPEDTAPTEGWDPYEVWESRIKRQED